MGQLVRFTFLCYSGYCDWSVEYQLNFLKHGNEKKARAKNKVETLGDRKNKREKKAANKNIKSRFIELRVIRVLKETKRVVLTPFLQSFKLQH